MKVLKYLAGLLWLMFTFFVSTLAVLSFLYPLMIDHTAPPTLEITLTCDCNATGPAGLATEPTTSPTP